MGKLFQYKKLKNENYLDTNVIGGFMRNLLHKKSIKNDVVTRIPTTVVAATFPKSKSYRKYCDKKKLNHKAAKTTDSTNTIHTSSPSTSSLTSACNNSLIIIENNKNREKATALIPNTSSISDRKHFSTSNNKSACHKTSESSSGSSASSYNSIRKKFCKTKKYNEPECNTIHKYQREEYASKYLQFKENAKKSNTTPETTSRIISTSISSSCNRISSSSSSSKPNSNHLCANNKENNQADCHSSSNHHKNSISSKANKTKRSAPKPSRKAPSTTVPNIPTAPPIESEYSQNQRSSGDTDFDFSNYTASQKQFRYHLQHKIGYYSASNQQNSYQINSNSFSAENSIANTSIVCGGEQQSESFNITETTFYPAFSSTTISNTSHLLLSTSSSSSSSSSTTQSNRKKTKSADTTTDNHTTTKHQKNSTANIIAIASNRNQKSYQEVPLSSSLYYHNKRQAENKNIIISQQSNREAAEQQQQKLQQHNNFTQDNVKAKSAAEREETQIQSEKSKNQLQPCHRIFYEENIKKQYDQDYHHTDNHHLFATHHLQHHHRYDSKKDDKIQQKPAENNDSNETRIFIVNEKFNEYNKDTTITTRTTTTAAAAVSSSKLPLTITSTTTIPSSFVGTLPKKKTKSKIYGFMKDFLKKKFCNNTTSSLNPNKEEGIYVELPNNIQLIDRNFVNNRTKYDTYTYSCKTYKQRSFDVMQDVRLRFELQPTSSSSQTNGPTASTTQSTSTVAAVAVAAAAAAAAAQQHQHSFVHQLQLSHHGASLNRLQNCRPIHLFQQPANHCNGTNSDSSSGGDADNVGQQSPHSPSSEEDNSPTEMNNCRRLGDKPPLVKRLTMGFLKSTEDSRPLVHIHSSATNCSPSRTAGSDGYVNEAICEPDKIISSKFGDSCRQSLTALPMLESRYYHDSHSEFNFKKKYLRETSSANSSPKMYAPSTVPLRIDTLSLAEQNELRGAPWFQAGIPREISLEVLSKQNPGAFLVRQSSTKPGCFALSLRCPPPAAKVAHYLILRTPKGCYKIKGFTKEFSSLRALITHHSVMPELLPVPLALPRPHHNTLSSRRHCDDFDTYDSLDDLRKQMSEL